MSFQYHSSRLFIFIALISPLADNKPGSILDLHIYLPDVFPDNPEEHKPYSPMKHTIHTVLAQPVTVLPSRLSITAHITPMKLRIETIIPSDITRRSGFTLRLVMPFNARLSILLKG